VYAHLGWIAVAFAAIGLLKCAIDQNDRWWRLVLQPDFVTCGAGGLDAERPPLDDHGL
jgi:hypothetical protein